MNYKMPRNDRGIFLKRKAPGAYRRLIQAMRKLFAVGGGLEPPRGS